jgi:hypothetical protein
MKRPSSRSLIALLLLWSAGLPALAGENFLAELEDLPLAPGLTELPGGLLFDSADGRIVEAKAAGEASAAGVRQFYEQSLAQLGWQSTGPLQFRRDNETLKILLEERGKKLTAHFTLTPTH